MKILIMGPGALGCAIARKLRKFYPVDLFGPRPPQGTEFLPLWKPFLPNKIDSPTLVLLTCKASQLQEVLQLELKALTDRSKPEALQNSLVLGLQNGLGIHSLIQTSGIPISALRAVAWFGARWDHGTLQETPPPHRITIADPESRINERLHQSLLTAGFAIEISRSREAPQIIEWKKALTSMALNPILTLEGAVNGQLLRSPELQAHARRIQEEAFRIFDRLQLWGITPEEAWKDLIRTCEETASNRNSMLQDLDAGRPLEVAWLNEWLIEKGIQLGIALPHNEELVRRLRSLSSGLTTSSNKA